MTASLVRCMLSISSISVFVVPSLNPEQVTYRSRGSCSPSFSSRTWVVSRSFVLGIDRVSFRHVLPAFSSDGRCWATSNSYGLNSGSGSRSAAVMLGASSSSNGSTLTSSSLWSALRPCRRGSIPPVALVAVPPVIPVADLQLLSRTSSIAMVTHEVQRQQHDETHSGVALTFCCFCCCACWPSSA
jgi:hypothetical protein